MRKVGAHVSVAGGLTNAIANTQNIGGTCLQIFAGSPRSWARKLYTVNEAREFKEAVRSRDFNPVFIHALYLVNLGSDQPELLDKSVTSLLFDLQNGDSLGAAGVIVHLGSHQGRGFESVRDQVADRIKLIIEKTSTTPFVIENSAGQQGKIGNFDEIEYLFKTIKSDRLKICLDTAHLFEGGWDLRKPKVVDDLVEELEKRDLLDKIICLHLNDSKTAFDSHHDQHANLGEGEIGLDGLRNFVNHYKLKNLPLILEVPGSEGWPDTKNIAVARSL